MYNIFLKTVAVFPFKIFRTLRTICIILPRAPYAKNKADFARERQRDVSFQTRGFEPCMRYEIFCPKIKEEAASVSSLFF